MALYRSNSGGSGGGILPQALIDKINSLSDNQLLLIKNAEYDNPSYAETIGTITSASNNFRFNSSTNNFYGMAIIPCNKLTFSQVNIVSENVNGGNLILINEDGTISIKAYSATINKSGIAYIILTTTSRNTNMYYTIRGIS